MTSDNLRFPGLKEIAPLLRSAKHVVVFTGAGVSAESGIPTFRDELTGLWANLDPEDLSTRRAFKRDPALVWGWYEWLRMKMRRAQPNPAHIAIAAMESKVPRLTVITQNIDDLHQRAGSQTVLHLHGSLEHPHCFACCRPGDYSLESPGGPDVWQRIEPPRCTHCGTGRLRPGVVWFGEKLPKKEWDAAFDATRHCDVFLCIGTSAVVQPAASLPIEAIRRRVVTLQINPNPTELDRRVTANLSGPAGTIIPALVDTVWGNNNS